MKTISINYKDVLQTISQDEINGLNASATKALETLYNGSGEGNDFLGWLDLPTRTTEDQASSR